MFRLATMFAVVVLGSTHAFGEFTNIWDRVIGLPAPSTTVRTVVAQLGAKGYTCKIPVGRYQSLSLWTTNLTAQTPISLASSASRNASSYEQVVKVKASCSLSTDGDGNLRAQLAENSWVKEDPTVAQFYFQFSGPKGRTVVFQYQQGIVNEKVRGSAEFPQAFTPSESVTPDMFYGTQAGSTLADGEYHLSANLREGARYYFGVGREVATNCLLGVYNPTGEQVNLDVLTSFPAWHDVTTNVYDEITCMTNSETHMSVTVRYSIATNYEYVVSREYEIIGVMTNVGDVVIGPSTNLVNVTTNILGVATNSYPFSVENAFVQEIVTNFEYYVNSIQTNLVKVTNVVESGVCRTAWQYVPSVSGDYTFVFRGSGGQSFSLFHAALRQRSPGNHPNVHTLTLDQSASCIPGWMNDPESGFYDGVIDQSLYRLVTQRGASYSISLTDVTYPILVRAYDSGGSVLREQEIQESTNLSWMSFVADSSLSYIGVSLLSERDSSGIEQGFPIGIVNELQETGTTSVWEHVESGYEKVEHPEFNEEGAIVSPTNAVEGTDGCWYVPTYQWKEVERPVTSQVERVIYGIPTNEVGIVVSLLSRYVDDMDPMDDECCGQSLEGRFDYAPTMLAVAGETVTRNLFRDDSADWYSLELKAGYGYRVDLQVDSTEADAVLELEPCAIQVLEETGGRLVFWTATNAVCRFRVCHEGPSTMIDNCYTLKVQRELRDALGAQLYPEDEVFVGNGAVVYDGFLFQGGVLSGTIQVKASTTKKNITTVAATVQLTGGKYTYSKGVVQDGVVTGLIAAKSGAPVLDLVLGADGLYGTCGGYLVKGARNGMGKAGDKLSVLKKDYMSWWTLDCVYVENGVERNARLFLSVGTAGAVKVSGFLSDGTTFSAKTQMILGQDSAYVPVLIATKNGTKLRMLIRMTPTGKVFLEDGGLTMSNGEDAQIILSMGGRSDASLILALDTLDDYVPMVGVEYWAQVKMNALSRPVIFSAKGLPNGLRLASGTGLITGVPTKAGTFTVTITAKTTDVPTVSVVKDVVLKVRPLPFWASGTFNGAVFGSTNDVRGLMSLTVTSKGKISGKLQRNGLVWSLTAASYGRIGVDAENPVTVLPVKVIGKVGRQVVTNQLVVVEDVADLPADMVRGRAEMAFDADDAVAVQNLWKTELFKATAKSFEHKTLEVVPGVTLKFAKTGMVTATGRFVTGSDGKGKDIVYKATSSTILIPCDETASQFSVHLYFPPKVGRFDGFAQEFVLNWDGVQFMVEPRVD